MKDTASRAKASVRYSALRPHRCCDRSGAGGRAGALVCNPGKTTLGAPGRKPWAPPRKPKYSSNPRRVGRNFSATPKCDLPTISGRVAGRLPNDQRIVVSLKGSPIASARSPPGSPRGPGIEFVPEPLLVAAGEQPGTRGACNTGARRSRWCSGRRRRPAHRGWAWGCRAPRESRRRHSPGRQQDDQDVGAPLVRDRHSGPSAG